MSLPPGEEGGPFRSFFLSTTQGIVFHAADGRIVDANDAACRMLGLSRDMLLGKTSMDPRWRAMLPDGSPLPGNLHPAMRCLESGKEVDPTVFGVAIPETGETRWIEVRAAPLPPGSGEARVFAAFDDVGGRLAMERERLMDAARFEGLARIYRHQDRDLSEFLDFALDQCILLTDSRIGYLYFYDDEKRLFTLNSWSKGVMEVCSVAEKRTVYELDKTGIWGEAVRQRKPIVVNDFAAPNPLKRGLPEGHAPLARFLTVPVFASGAAADDRATSDDRATGVVVAVIGVANKTLPYDDTDTRQLSLMMDAVWRIVLRARADIAVENLLKEKEMLLKETHHRVKNNMAMVMSLLSLQASSVEDEAARKALEDAATRLRAMASLYDSIFRAEWSGSLAASAFLGPLADGMAAAFERPDVRVVVDADETRLEAGLLAPLAILVNELFTNSMKYAFPSRGGTVSISLLSRDGARRLEYRDDGPGLPDKGRVAGFGLKLVELLSAQLGGRCEPQRPGDSRFLLEF